MAQTDIVSLRNRLAAATKRGAALRSRGEGQLWGLAGGVLGAAVKRYLPRVIPGEGADDAAVFIATMAVDLGALASSGEEMNYVAAGLNGYIGGNAIEKILP